VIYWLAAALLGGLAALAAARHLPSPHWIDALIATGGCAALALALGVGLLLRGILRARWLAPTSLLAGAGAAGGRAYLVARVTAAPAARLVVDFAGLGLAAATVVWGALALGWGALAVSDACGAGGRGRWPGGVAGGGAVALGLHSLAPLWLALGLRINHWTALGLLGLALVGWGAGQGWRRLRGPPGTPVDRTAPPCVGSGDPRRRR
jgi:hypothetical protein